MSSDDSREPPSGEEGGSSGETFLPEINVFFLTGSRHDRDRIEIQIGFDGLLPKESDRKFSYTFDCLLFVPKTVGLAEIEDVQQLREEFQSYIRLHTHAANPKRGELNLHRVRERLQQTKDHLTHDTLRVFAIELESFLKGQTRKVKRRSLSADSLASELESVQYLMSDFRSILKARGLEGKDADELPRKSIDHDLLLLNEYVSHLYVQYLVETDYACRISGGMTPAIKILEESIHAESQARQTYHFLVEQRHAPESAIDEELYPRRISLLKKYFQKSIFIHVTGESLQKKMLVPVYGMSAVLAASFIFMVQIYQARTVAERVGINSVALFSIAVFAYAIKDILKELTRRFFFKTSSRWVPDYKKVLYHKRNHGKTIRIGSINEYLRVLDSGRLPEDLREARYSVRGGEMEEYLHEDTLHFKKRVNLDLSKLDSREEFPWGVREILRYRFDRMLHSLEDPFKNMHLVSTTGSPVTRQAHRVYHIYLATWIYVEDQNPQKQHRQHKPFIQPSFKAFRVTLDKSGVLDCTQVDWKRNDEAPSIP